MSWRHTILLCKCAVQHTCTTGWRWFLREPKHVTAIVGILIVLIFLWFYNCVHQFGIIKLCLNSYNIFDFITDFIISATGLSFSSDFCGKCNWIRHCATHQREFYRRDFKPLLFIQVHDTTYHRIVIVSATNLTFPLFLGYYKCVLSNVHYD